MATFNFNYNEGMYKQIPVGNGQVKHELYATKYHEYTVAIYPLNDSLMTITHKCTLCDLEDKQINYTERAKTVKVNDNSEYIYKIMKTQVQGCGGVSGLFNNFQKYANDKFWQPTLHNALSNILDVTKGIN